eukprot:g3543.t1
MLGEALVTALNDGGEQEEGRRGPKKAESKGGDGGDDGGDHDGDDSEQDRCRNRDQALTAIIALGRQAAGELRLGLGSNDVGHVVDRGSREKDADGNDDDDHDEQQSNSMMILPGRQRDLRVLARLLAALLGVFGDNAASCDIRPPLPASPEATAAWADESLRRCVNATTSSSSLAAAAASSAAAASAEVATTSTTGVERGGRAAGELKGGDAGAHHGVGGSIAVRAIGGRRRLGAALEALGAIAGRGQVLALFRVEQPEQQQGEDAGPDEEEGDYHGATGGGGGFYIDLFDRTLEASAARYRPWNDDKKDGGGGGGSGNGGRGGDCRATDERAAGGRWKDAPDATTLKFAIAWAAQTLVYHDQPRAAVAPAPAAAAAAAADADADAGRASGGGEGEGPQPPVLSSPPNGLIDGAALGHLLPLLFALADDYQEVHQRLGLEGLLHVFRHAAPAAVRPFGQVACEVLSRCLVVRSASTLDLALTCLVECLALLEPVGGGGGGGSGGGQTTTTIRGKQGSKSSARRLRLLERITVDASRLSHQPELVECFLRAAPPLILAVGVDVAGLLGIVLPWLLRQVTRAPLGAAQPCGSG